MSAKKTAAAKGMRKTIAMRAMKKTAAMKKKTAVMRVRERKASESGFKKTNSLGSKKTGTSSIFQVIGPRLVKESSTQII